MNWNPFKFFWLASDERKELKKLKAEKQQRLAVALELNKVVKDVTTQVNEQRKPYDKLIWTGNTVILVLWDESIIGPLPCNNDQRLVIKDMQDIDNIIGYLTPVIKEVEVEKEEKLSEENVKDALELLRNNKDFEIIGQDIYLSGISVKLPDVIISSFMEILEKKQYYSIKSSVADGDSEDLNELEKAYESLKYFWCKLVNSPIKDRDNVLLFCKKNDIRLSPLGAIIAYRRVIKLPLIETNNILDAFVKENYEKIVKRWKKSAKDYEVFRDIDGNKELKLFKKNYFTKHVEDLTYECVGSLDSLLKDIKEDSSVQLYTSSHNKGKYTFTIPGFYKLIDEEPNPNVNNCSSGGLHFGSKDFNFTGYGDTKVCVLIDPSKAIYVPLSESGKARTSEMFITCIFNQEGHIDEKLIEKADIEYNQYTIDQLKKAVEGKTFDNFSIKTSKKLLIPEATLLDMEKVIKLLENKVINI